MFFSGGGKLSLEVIRGGDNFGLRGGGGYLMLGLIKSCLTCPAVTVKEEETLGLVHLGESTVTDTLVVREVVTNSSTLMVTPLFSM